MMSSRKICVSVLFVGALAGCDTTSVPAASAPKAPVTTFATGGSTSNPAGGPSVAETRIVDVEIVYAKRPRKAFLGLSEEKVIGTLDRKATSVLGAANPNGTARAKAVILVRSIELATAEYKQKEYDSTVNAEARLFDVETGQRIGGVYPLGGQASYRPAFAGGRSKVLSPEQELDLITTHAVTKLKENIYE